MAIYNGLAAILLAEVGRKGTGSGNQRSRPRKVMTALLNLDSWLEIAPQAIFLVPNRTRGSSRLCGDGKLWFEW